jgi:uncharacterized protein (TIGR02186 family)
MTRVRSMFLLAMALLLAAGGLAAAQPSPGAVAQKEALDVDLSSHEVSIKTDFSGIKVVVFGAVNNSRQPSAASGFYDVAVVLRGPEQAIIVRRKDRIAGLWVNADSMAFQDVPSFYAVLSTRPLNEIADEAALLRYGIGFESLALVPRYSVRPHTKAEYDAFRQAIIDIKKREKLYREEPFSVGFIGTSLFRSTIDLPSNVPVGDYTADVFLFREGKLLSAGQSSITIGKGGIGQFVHKMAFNWPLLYGIAAALVAVVFGLAASAIFRKG